MDKPTIFFSHSSKDRDLILPIKNKLAEITSGTMGIFMSSDGQSIPLGRNWVSKIEEGLKNAQIMFIFVTPNSIISDWIYFEAGYAYSKEIEVIPVGIGVHIGELKAPLNLLQGFDVSSHESLNNFISVINKKFNLSFKESFVESDYNVINQIFSSEKNSIVFSRDIIFCECGYNYFDKDQNVYKFFKKIEKYLSEKQISYSYYNGKLLFKGIKILIKDKAYNKDNSYSYKLIFKLSPKNIEESFNILVEIFYLIDISSFKISFVLNDNLICVQQQEDISSIVSTTDCFYYITNKIGHYKYKDIIWSLEDTPYKNCLDLYYDTDKVSYTETIELMNKLYDICIIQEKV